MLCRCWKVTWSVFACVQPVSDYQAKFRGFQRWKWTCVTCASVQQELQTWGAAGEMQTWVHIKHTPPNSSWKSHFHQRICAAFSHCCSGAAQQCFMLSLRCTPANYNSFSFSSAVLNVIQVKMVTVATRYKWWIFCYGQSHAIHTIHQGWAVTYSINSKKL